MKLQHMWSMALLNVRCGKKLFCLNSCLSNLNVSHSSETTKNYLLPPCSFSLVFHYNELYFFSLYVCLCAKFCAPAPDPPAPTERIERYLKLTTDDKYYSLTGGNSENKSDDGFLPLRDKLWEIGISMSSAK